MQSLREEEEEKIAEEEVVDNVPLTYDRPDLSNKVTLRRSSMGTWKVCSSDQCENESAVLKLPITKEKASFMEKSIDEGHSSKRVLRSGKPCHVALSGARVMGDLHNDGARVRGDLHSDDPEYKPKAVVRHRKATRSNHRAYVVEDMVVDRRSLRNSDSDISSTRTLTSKIGMCRDGECLVPSRVCGNGSDLALVPCSSCSFTGSDDSTLNLSMESLSSNNSHNCLIRQQPNDDVVV